MQYKTIHNYHPYLEAGSSIRNMMHIAVGALLVKTSSF